MGGGAVPEPATNAGNYQSQPLCSPTVSPLSFNFSTGSPDSLDETKNRTIRYPNQTNFGPVPSEIEVQNAISDLRRAMNGYCATSSSEVYEFGEIMGERRLVDAYNLLQTDPLVQRLVLSISSDNEVWDAILKNDAVQNLQGSVPITEEGDTGYKCGSNATSPTAKWIFTFMKSKIMEFMETLEVLVFKTLYSGSQNTRSTSELDDILEDKVRSSLLLSIVILVIVFVTRSIDA